MKGLMLKEYYVVRRYAKTYALYILIFGGAAVFSGNMGMFGAMSVIFISTIPLSSFSVDDYCKWGMMAVSSPVSRKQIVASKYLLMLSCMGISLLIGVAVAALGAVTRPDVLTFGDGIVSIAACLCIMSIGMMVLLPIIIKMGAEKGRIMMMLIFGATFVVILLGAMLAENMGMIGNASDSLKLSITMAVTVVVPLILLLVTFVSYKVSCTLYAKKEL